MSWCQEHNCPDAVCERASHAADREQDTHVRLAQHLAAIVQERDQLRAHVLALTEARDRLQQENQYLKDANGAHVHELSLIRADVAAEQTDCSTPIFQLVRNRSERVAKLEAQVQALDAAASWQPIATAPKDGTPVLVYDEGAICLAAFDEDTGYWYDYGLMSPAPTLWQSLPPPPAPSADGEAL